MIWEGKGERYKSGVKGSWGKCQVNFESLLFFYGHTVLQCANFNGNSRKNHVMFQQRRCDLQIRGHAKFWLSDWPTNWLTDRLTIPPTNFTELSPSWVAINCAATQELPSILWNLKVIAMFTRALHFPRPFVPICNKLIFYAEELLAPRPTSKLADHPLSAVHDCLFNIFAATFLIWRLSPPSATWGHAMLWRQGTHLILLAKFYLVQ
jgi:hypothetical protein